MEDANVPLVGLTGGMGAGKSTALKLLQELGADVLSTDAVVHELYGDARVRDAVVQRWGPEVLGEDGGVDRSAVAARAFASPDERKWLEGLLWPLVGERMMLWAQDARARPGASCAVVEVPLLFEAGMEGAFDATIAIVADEPIREGRAASRGHAAASERNSRQLSQEEKAQRATFAVANDGSIEDLRRALTAVLAKLSG